MDTDMLIEKMLEKLDDSEESMKNQTGAIGDIVEKSNNILLQIEATRCSKPPPKMLNDGTAFTYTKDNLHALATIVESFQTVGASKTPLLKKDDNQQQIVNNFEIFLQNTNQKMEILGGSVRKLLAINDTVSQMKTNLECNADSESE